MLQRVRERGLVLGGEADDHVRRQVELSRQLLESRQERARRVPAAHRAQNAVVAGLERNVEMLRDGRRLAERGDEPVAHVVDLDRAEPEALQAWGFAGRSHEHGQVVPGRAIAETAEVDPGEHDLAVALLDAPADLAENRFRRAAARAPADERDDAERARERASILDLHERPHAVEPRVGLHAPDRADVARHECGGLLGPLADHDDVRGQGGERIAREVRGTAGHVDPPVGAGRPGGRLAALRQRLVRDAAGADHGDVGVPADRLGVAVGEQALTDLLRVRMRDLAAEKVSREASHGGIVLPFLPAS